MGWFSRIPKLKQAVEEEKNKHDKYESACIHGEIDCVRCMVENLRSPKQYTVWSELDPSDIRKIVVQLPSSAREMLRKNPGVAVLAGGYIRATVGNEPIRDTDIFVNSELTATTVLNSVDRTGTQKGKICQLTDQIQVCWNYPFTQPYEILEQFDYTVAKAAIWFDAGDEKNPETSYKGICHERFYKDIARKILCYDSDRDTECLGSIPRLLKYSSYGYHIEPKSLATVLMKACLSLDLDHGSEGLTKQLEDYYLPTGDDTQWKTYTTKYEKPKPKPQMIQYSSGS